MRFLTCLLLSAAAIEAQTFAIGMKGGVRLTDDVEGSATSQSRRYAVGPMVEVALPHRFTIEAGALYSRFGFESYYGAGPFGDATTRGRANVWEFPLVARYRLVHGLYAGAGYAPRRISGSAYTQGTFYDYPSGNYLRYSAQSSSNYGVTHGIVAVAGVQLRRGHLGIAPEVRYTHWNAGPLNLYGSHGYYVNMKLDEVRVLAGLTFR